MTLDEVKSVIYCTDCKQYIFEGLSCSEPIMTMDKGRLIDNYFIYSHDEYFKKISEPIIEFGIVTGDKKEAYGRQVVDELECRVMDETAFNIDRAMDAYEEYANIYPFVRQCVYSSKLTREQVEYLKKYLECLRIFSGDVLWKIYLERYPQFFDWVQSEIQNEEA